MPSPTNPHDNVRTFKTRLAGIRRRKRFVPTRESRALGEELRGLLSMLDDRIEARMGVELVAEFFRADEAVFSACDDSNGYVGDVFRLDARDRFVAFAARCDDKEWVAGVVFDLLEADDYGVRDSVLDEIERYLPEPVLRALAEREWKAAESVIPLNDYVRDYARRHHLGIVEMIARRLKDARMCERATRARVPELGTAACIHIAEVWLSAGDPATALGWLDRVKADAFKADERDRLLAAVYRAIGCHEDLEALAWRRFRAVRSPERLDALVDVIGAGGREAAVAEAVEDIRRAPKFKALDVAFLLSCGRAGEASDYVIKRREQIDGDYYSDLLPLAREFTVAKDHLAATVIYRALMESILARAKSVIYGHAVRYYRHLDRVADMITDWKGVPPHGEYVESLRARHCLKSSFWKRLAEGDHAAD